MRMALGLRFSFSDYDSTLDILLGKAEVKLLRTRKFQQNYRQNY